MNTIFALSINLCTDPDLDLPLIYRFKVIKEDSTSYTLCSAKKFNSINLKMFAGTLIAYVEVCDQLKGCTNYESQMIVAPYQRRQLAMKDATLQQYITDTSNIELIPIYSIAYLNTFTLSSYDISYIYDDVLSYINTRTSIDSEVVGMILSIINEITHHSPAESLTYANIEMYLQTLISLVQNSTDQLTSKDIKLIFSIAERVLIIGNFTSDYIQLSNIFLNILVEDYSLNMLPGTLIAYIPVKNVLTYYKQRELSVDFTNTSI